MVDYNPTNKTTAELIIMVEDMNRKFNGYTYENHYLKTQLDEFRTTIDQLKAQNMELQTKINKLESA